MARTVRNITRSPVAPYSTAGANEVMIDREEDDDGNLIRIRIYGRNQTSHAYMEFAPLDPDFEPELIGAVDLTPAQQAQALP